MLRKEILPERGGYCLCLEARKYVRRDLLGGDYEGCR